MKNLILLAVAVLITFNANAQVSQSIILKFDSKSQFENQFTDKEHSKSFNCQVLGINSAIDEQVLIHYVTSARGVESFTITTNENGTKSAQLVVYRYATGWWYWQSFMDKTGIKTFRIAEQSFTKETIINQ